jgi:hypothetical protein
MGKAKKMGALEISRITRRSMNFAGGVAGLGMNVNSGGSRSWVLRARVGGVRRDMGLGGYPDVTLAQARESARGATWAEFDLDGALWVVPAERMKAKKEHRVPLSDRAVELLRAQLEISHSDFAFPAPKGGALSDMTLTAVLRRMEVDAVPHGFRSTFRDWAAEQTDYPNEVAEMALAHAVGNKVEAAYRRGDLLEKRVQLMRDWSSIMEQVWPANVRDNADTEARVAS